MTADEVVMVPMRRVPVGKRGARLGEAAPLCKFPDAVVERALALRAQGLTHKEVAAAIGCSKGTALRWAKGMRHKTPLRHKLVPLDAAP